MPLKPRKTIKKELRKLNFRVTIFGSARINQDNPVYKQTFDLAKRIGKMGFDVVTGGGPGIMEAASAGHQEGDIKNLAKSIGLIIKLPWKPKKNTHLEISKHFGRFSRRLDNFIALTSVMVIMPGGIGTCLELFYAWQAMQVKHVREMPIILIGKMWKELIKWVKKYPLKQGLISPVNMAPIYIAKNNTEAMKVIKKEHQKFKREKGKHHLRKYNIDSTDPI